MVVILSSEVDILSSERWTYYHQRGGHIIITNLMVVILSSEVDILSSEVDILSSQI